MTAVDGEEEHCGTEENIFMGNERKFWLGR